MDNTETLDRTSEIAKAELAKIEAKEKADQVVAELKAKKEADIAFSEKSPAEQQRITEQEEQEKTAADEVKKEKAVKEKEKTEAEEKLKNAKPDEDLLKAEDKDLNEEEIARKKVLVDKVEKSKSPEQKLKDWQDTTQKRIDELSGALKAEKEGRIKDADTIKILENNIADLKDDLTTSGSIESQSVKDGKADEESYAKMVEEDKSLPREERREMSDDELEEFMLEDNKAASVWIAERALRRRDEIDTRKESRKSDANMTEQAKKFYAEYPGCETGFVKVTELIKSGKSEKEARESVSAENKDFSLMMEIFAEDKKYSNPENGPEIMFQEMQKRKALKAEPKPQKESYTKEEVDAMIEEKMQAEKDRQASIDHSLTNTVVPDKIVEGSPLYKAQWEVWLKASKRPGAKGEWSKKEFERVLQYGKDNRKAEREDALENV